MTQGLRAPLAVALLCLYLIGSAKAEDSKSRERAIAEARALIERAKQVEASGKRRTAADLYGQAASAFDALDGHEEEHALALGKQAVALLYEGEARSALAPARRALEIRRGFFKGDHTDIAASLNNLAFAYNALGSAAKALPLYEEALGMFRRLFQGDHADVASALANLALGHVRLGRSAEALPLLEESLAMRRRLFPGDHEAVATGLNGLAFAHKELGHPREALPLFEECLAMLRRLNSGEDHPHVATCLENLASTYSAQGRTPEALPRQAEAVAMFRRLFPGDHPYVARSLGNQATYLSALGRTKEALPLEAEALAMRRRIFPEGHPHVATNVNNLAATYHTLGRLAEALPLYEEALAMFRKIFEGDHPRIASCLRNTASIVEALGRAAEALPLAQESLAMSRRIFEGDHPHIASCLRSTASIVEALGRAAEALPLAQESLAMSRRLFLGDHPESATSLRILAFICHALGRAADALPLMEDALAMRRRLFPGDHPSVSTSLGDLAYTLDALGRKAEALPLEEEALSMFRRMFEGDHPLIARSLTNVAATYEDLGRIEEALPLKQEALAMRRRLVPGDHPHLAMSQGNLASSYWELGRTSESLALSEESLAMRRRLFPDGHSDIALSLSNLASMYWSLGRNKQAQRAWNEAIAMGERTSWPEIHVPRSGLAVAYLEAGDPKAAVAELEAAAANIETRRREAASLGTGGRARYVANLRRWDPFPLLIEAKLALGQPDQALHALERGRGRELLALLERGQVDIEARALELARESNDTEKTKSVLLATGAIRAAEAALVVASRTLERARQTGRLKEIRAAARVKMAARKDMRDAARKRLHVVRDSLPEAAPRSVAQIQALLHGSERLLAYSLGDRASFVFVVRPPGQPVEAVRLGTAKASLTLRQVTGAVEALRDALTSVGGVDAAKEEGFHHGARLFKNLVPAMFWRELKAASRVYIIPHGPLHALPFEALEVADSRYWVDEGPPIAYVSSGSVLAWLREPKRRAAPELALVAVGDPIFGNQASWPETGVVITDVTPNSQAEERGLLRGDIITQYGDTEVRDLDGLLAALRGVAPKTEFMKLRYEREGATETVRVKPGQLGVHLAKEAPPVAGPRLLERLDVGTVLRSGRAGSSLARLPGTRKEVEAIRDAHHAARRPGRVVTLLGAEATEARLFRVAQSPRLLHLATHGLVDETKSASFSSLALTPPRLPVPGNDGFLTVHDLLTRWRGQLEGTDLVVLSACESQRGKLETDDGMFALPWGFCFAGARSAIGSLWLVDDASTAQLMAEFYKRLFTKSAPSPCDALHAARRALRSSHPDPYYWAPFVFVGAP